MIFHDDIVFDDGFLFKDTVFSSNFMITFHVDMMLLFLMNLCCFASLACKDCSKGTSTPPPQEKEKGRVGDRKEGGVVQCKARNF